MAKNHDVRNSLRTIVIVWTIVLVMNAVAPSLAAAQTPEPDSLRVTHAELPLGWELFDYSGGFVPGDPWIDLLFIHPDPEITLPRATLFLNRYPSWADFTMEGCLDEAEDFDLTLTTLFSEDSLRLVNGSGETHSREAVGGFDAEIREQQFEIEEWVPGTTNQSLRWEWISDAWIRNYCIDVPSGPVSIALAAQPEHYPEAVEFIDTIRFSMSGSQDVSTTQTTEPQSQITPTSTIEPTPTIEPTVTPEPAVTVAIDQPVLPPETPLPEATPIIQSPTPDPPVEPVMGIGIPLWAVALLFGLAGLIALSGIGLVTFLVVMGVRSRRRQARGDDAGTGERTANTKTETGTGEQTLSTARQPGEVCRACGALLEEGHAFCTFCGTAVLATEVEPQFNRCHQCSQPIEPDSRFCTRCGAARS